MTTSATPAASRLTRLGENRAPLRPTAARILPQFGSPPESAVLTRGEVATACNALAQLCRVEGDLDRAEALYTQVLALMRDRSPQLELAETMLFIPDLFHYWMTGVKVNEYTDASTSQLIDAGTRSWARPLVRAFGIPEKILGTLVQPGTVLGPLRPSVHAVRPLSALKARIELGMAGLSVIG